MPAGTPTLSVPQSVSIRDYYIINSLQQKVLRISLQGSQFDPTIYPGEFPMAQKARRKRTSISHAHLVVLRKVFVTEPFPSRATVNRLSSEIGLPFRVSMPHTPLFLRQ
jgi:Homeodomain